MPYTAASIKEWLEKHPDNRKKARSPTPTQPVRYENPSDINVDEHNHDTVTVLALDKKGHLGGVCTTSGLAYKLPGRVGDSPIIGAGLYVDDLAGAAGATGVGEEIIRIGGSLFIVEQMRGGQEPAGGVRAGLQAGERRGRAARRPPGGGGVPGARPEGQRRRGLHPEGQLPLRRRPRRQGRDGPGEGDRAGGAVIPRRKASARVSRSQGVKESGCDAL